MLDYLIYFNFFTYLYAVDNYNIFDSASRSAETSQKYTLGNRHGPMTGRPKIGTLKMHHRATRSDIICHYKSIVECIF